jgi:membrane dipeptidase
MWRERPSLTPDEARQLHHNALVIDTKFPGMLSVPSARVRAVFDEERKKPGVFRQQVYARTKAAAVRELWRAAEARAGYLDMWRQSGLTAGVVSTVLGQPDGEVAFQECLRTTANEVYAPILASGGEIRIAVKAQDIEDAHRARTHAIVVGWENSTPLGADLGRLDLFYNLGLRNVQLTYNLRNLVGDGCAERTSSGLSKFGVELVERLEERRIMVDVAHASPSLARDVLRVAKAPVCITHGSARDLFDHDRGTPDDVLKSIGERGGYIGIYVVAGFLQGRNEGSLGDVADHLEHVARLVGVDHVGIGTDFGDIYTIPAETARFETHYPPGFGWHGFTAAHRTFITKMTDYESVLDWPNITVQLARRGFTEDELRKILGLNYLRFFREIVG